MEVDQAVVDEDLPVQNKDDNEPAEKGDDKDYNEAAEKEEEESDKPAEKEGGKDDNEKEDMVEEEMMMAAGAQLPESMLPSMYSLFRSM